jgi:UDPglucose 6-dehydrogenase
MTQKLLTCTLLGFIITSAGFQPEKICVVGTGYVGLVAGVGFAHIGHDVTCVDIDQEKIARLLHNDPVIYEPGLQELMIPLAKNGSLKFSTDILNSMRNADIIYIGVGTPMSDDGSADLRYVYAATDDIAKTIDHTPKIICIKSTVPVGTCASVQQRLLDHGVPRHYFEVVSNPEFLREGSAVGDFLEPDRIVIGGEQNAAERIKKLYQPIIDKGSQYILTTLESSELIKYASNAMLATRIAFINEIARLCTIIHANVKDVATGMGLDSRIGPHFLNPGPGFGGSCFPKDVKALEYVMKKHGIQAKLIYSIFASNDTHKLELLQKAAHTLKNDGLKNKKIALLGLTFKANTDDIRYSFAIDAIQFFSQLDASVSAYDPQGAVHMKQLFPHVTYCDTAYAAIDDADLVIVVTEWSEFKTIDWKKYVDEHTQHPVILDLRNLYNANEMNNLGLQYLKVG